MTDLDLEPHHTEVWTYAGRRTKRAGGVFQLWIRPDGTEAAFEKVRANVVGGRYEVTLYGADGDSVGRTVNYTGERSDDPRAVAGWVLEDRAAYTQDEARKLEKRHTREAGDALGDLTLRDLHDRLASYGPRRAALLAQVLRYLGA